MRKQLSESFSNQTESYARACTLCKLEVVVVAEKWNDQSLPSVCFARRGDGGRVAPALLNRLKDGLRTHGVILMLWPLIFKRLSVDAAVQLEISWHQVEVGGCLLD